MPRRSYGHFCSLSRALDLAGERWTLLIVRELLADPRRYTDLHADLPGVSTDVLTARLREMEQDGLVARRRLPPPAAAAVYELTPRGRDLTPALTALAAWGAAEAAEPRLTDAIRAHWSALPLMHALSGLCAPRKGVVNVRLPEGSFHVVLGDGGPVYGHGPAEHPDAELALDSRACLATARGRSVLADLIREGRASVAGTGPLVDAMRSSELPGRDRNMADGDGCAVPDGGLS